MGIRRFKKKFFIFIIVFSIFSFFLFYYFDFSGFYDSSFPFNNNDDDDNDNLNDFLFKKYSFARITTTTTKKTEKIIEKIKQDHQSLSANNDSAVEIIDIDKIKEIIQLNNQNPKIFNAQKLFLSSSSTFSSSFNKNKRNQNQTNDNDHDNDDDDKIGLVLLIQVHNRLIYLRELINSLSRVKFIEQALLVLSHDIYDEEINSFVRNISFCAVLYFIFIYLFFIKIIYNFKRFTSL